MIEFNCPSCGQSYRVPDDKVGAEAKCKACEEMMVVPAPVEAVEHSDFEVEAPGLGRPDERGYVASGQAFGPGMAEPTRSQRRPLNRASRDRLLQGRPMSSGEEIDRRSRAIFILGIVLVTVFFLPACQPNSRGGGGLSLSFLNIELLFVSGVDAVTKLMLLYPLLAGVALAIIAYKMAPPMRGIAIAVLGLAPIVINLVQASSLNLFSQFGARMGSIGVAMIFLFLGLAGVFIGSRVRWYRPNLTNAYVIGAIGAAMLITSFFIPIHGDMMIAAPFKMMEQSVMGGLGVLIAVCLLIGAGVFCLINVPGNAQPEASRLSHIAFRALVGGTIIFPITLMLASIISAMQFGGDITLGLGIAWTMIKIIVWIIGVLLLLPMGVTDAMVDMPVTNPDGCSSCGYDLRGNTNAGVCPECGHVNW